MTAASLFIFGSAVLATLALVAWAWVWFAIRQVPPQPWLRQRFPGGEFEGTHFDSAIPGRARYTSASLLNQRQS